MNEHSQHAPVPWFIEVRIGVDGRMGAKGYSSIRGEVRNSVRHSGASTVSVSLQEHGTGVRLTIDDDGVECDPESRRAHGHGLRNIAARTPQIAGTLQVILQLTHGTHILVHVPGETSNVLP